MISTGTVAASLKDTLDEIMTDKDDGIGDSELSKYFEMSSMKDNWIEDIEYGGPGLASEKTEGEEIAVGGIRQGFRKVYRARTYGLKMIVTEEAQEDNKYEEVIKAGRRLKRSMFKTRRVDGALVLARGWNTSYPGGDNVPLFSASHPLANGGTASNTLSVALSPSRVALQAVIIAMGQLPGHDGIKEGYEPKKILCPYPQRFTWREILGSEYAPEAGEYNRINVINRDFDLELVPLLFWDNTTTNWCVKSDAENGFRWLDRRKPKSGTWMDNDRETMKHKVSARWDRGVSNWRTAYGSQA